MAQVQWSDLPGEILLLIFQKLKDPSDVYQCGSVCVSWKSIIRTVLPHCLLLSNVGVLKDEIGRLNLDASLNKQSCILFDTQTNQTHEICLPEVEGTWFCSSSFGWLLTVGFKTPHRIHLLNPFTSDQIELPSARKFKRPDQLRVITSTSPLDPKCLALASHLHRGELAVCKPGDVSWTIVQYFDSVSSDAIFYKNKFYVVDFGGDLYRVSCNIVPIAAKLSLRPIQFVKERFWRFNHLVELDGNLLLVVRFINQIRYDSYESDMPCAFEVYELNWTEKEWIKVNSIGNNSILLGVNSSISLRVSPTRNFKANCIYFINDNSLPFMLHQYNTGVYDMMTGNLEYLYRSSAIWTSPLNWFIPAVQNIYRGKTAEEKSWSSRILKSLQKLWVMSVKNFVCVCLFFIIIVCTFFIVC